MLRVIAVLAIFGIGVVSYQFLERGVTVVVNNATGDEITDLQIMFRGGRKSSPKLKPDEYFKTKVQSEGESDLDVEYVDSSGKRHSAKIDVYLETNYRGAIYITLEPNGKATWKDNARYF